MIKPPSLQKEYTLIFSGDPALDLPVVPTIADDSTDEHRAEAKKIAEERVRILKVARETGKWPIRPGETPTLFHFRPVPGTTQTYMFGEAQRKRLTGLEIGQLAFRIALTRIDNYGDLKVTRSIEDGESLVDREVVDELFASPIGRAVVNELGGIVFNRITEPVSPL